MNTDKSRPTFAFHKTPVVTREVVAEAEMISSTLSRQVELSLDDNVDTGSDPYNTTGQHVAIRQVRRKG